MMVRETLSSTNTCLISLEFPNSFYEQATAITITDDMQPLFLCCLQHREYYQIKWQLHVIDLLEGMPVEFLKAFSYRFPERHQNSNSPLQYPAKHLQSHNINATSPAKMSV